MRKRREIPLFSISFLDLLSGALGAVIILFVAIPKKTKDQIAQKDDVLVTVMRTEIKSSTTKIAELERQLRDAQDKLKSQAAVQIGTPAAPLTEGKPANLDIGFKFKGKEIVFIIDTSFSMNQEDRMGQVKAGLKMLLTALPEQYKIEVVQFPFGERAPFKSLWGAPREANSYHKHEAFEFIYSLRPDGGTPTRDVLKFVLENYQDVTDIVLLTDGAPSLHNSNKKDDIYEIMKDVRNENRRKVQINSIGVGSDFIKDQTSERYKFLSLLSQETGGFFVGF